MMERKHSPLRIEKSTPEHGSECYWIQIDEHDQPTFKEIGNIYGPQNEENDRLTTFIVRACNNHYKLLAFAKETLEGHRRGETDEFDPCLPDGLIELIAEAESE